MRPLDETIARNIAAPDGIRVSYETHGAGSPALVFVHGWSCDRGYWRGQLEPFSRRFKVVAVDLGGHRESGADRERWTIASFGADVAAVVEAEDLAPIILIGHSMGGDVILEAARRLKGRVAGLVWVDVYSRLGTPRTFGEVQATLAPFRAAFGETTPPFVRGMFRSESDPALVEEVARDMSAAPQHSRSARSRPRSPTSP